MFKYDFYKYLVLSFAEGEPVSDPDVPEDSIEVEPSNKIGEFFSKIGSAIREVGKPIGNSEEQRSNNFSYHGKEREFDRTIYDRLYGDGRKLTIYRFEKEKDEVIFGISIIQLNNGNYLIHFANDKGALDLSIPEDLIRDDLYTVELNPDNPRHEKLLMQFLEVFNQDIKEINRKGVRVSLRGLGEEVQNTV